LGRHLSPDEKDLTVAAAKSLEILTYPDERLTHVSTLVERFDDELGAFLDAMRATMVEAAGIGLAAPQVNRPQRFFIIDLGLQEGYEKKLYELINPKLTKGSGKIVYQEGCLSVPGLAEDVTRKERITVDFQDRFGKWKKLEAEGLLAVAIQHENDHLDGVLFVDRLPVLRRRLAKRKLAKQVRL
jgi:peptide deformylase